MLFRYVCMCMCVVCVYVCVFACFLCMVVCFFVHGRGDVCGCVFVLTLRRAGYIAGLVTTVAVMHTFKAAQVTKNLFSICSLFSSFVSCTSHLHSARTALPGACLHWHFFPVGCCQGWSGSFAGLHWGSEEGWREKGTEEGREKSKIRNRKLAVLPYVVHSCLYFCITNNMIIFPNISVIWCINRAQRAHSQRTVVKSFGFFGRYRWETRCKHGGRHNNDGRNGTRLAILHFILTAQLNSLRRLVCLHVHWCTWCYIHPHRTHTVWVGIYPCRHCKFGSLVVIHLDVCLQHLLYNLGYGVVNKRNFSTHQIKRTAKKGIHSKAHSDTNTQKHIFSAPHMYQIHRTCITSSHASKQ